MLVMAKVHQGSCSSVVAAVSMARKGTVLMQPYSAGSVRGRARRMAFHNNDKNPNRLIVAARSMPDVESHMHLDLYQVLGVADQKSATQEEIRSCYKYLAKHAHPDVSGDEHSAAFALINKAYEVLSDPKAKLMYDSGRSLFGEHSAFGDFTGEPLSHNAKPGHPSANFVDENTCIGCRACVHEAPNTFTIDEAYGKARVETQWADSEERIAIAREMCPVNCIHLVASKDIAVLEFVQRSMAPRHMIINSDMTMSGGARGMEESPFVAAERFEAKKAKLMSEAEAKAHAAKKMEEAMESIRRSGIIPGSWFFGRGRRGGRSGNADGSKAAAGPVNGPCCPLIIPRGTRLLLPAPLAGPDEHRPGV